VLQLHCSARRLVFAGLTLTGLVVPCFGQQVPTEPTSTHIFPAGGRRGTVVPVRVGGEFLPPYTRFGLIGAGVSAPAELVEQATGYFEPSPRRKPGGSPITYPREWKSEIAIAADAPLGQILWRVSSARGGAGGRPFLVGDLPEYIETESNSTPETAEHVDLPVTINGQIAGERDFDYFRFDATAGDVVSVDVAAARLGSPLDPVIELQDANVRRLPVQEIRVGSDPVLAFHVPSTGEYRLLVTNLNFHGGPQYVYRITVTTAPYVAFAYPPGAHRGITREVELFTLDGTGGLNRRAESVAFPAQGPREFVFSSAIPTANPVVLEATDLPAVLEGEPNETAAAATAVICPTVVYGRLSSWTDNDWYTFTASKDEALTVDCRPLPAGSGSLPVISLCDANGGVLAKASTVELLPKACRLEWRAPVDGKYLLRVNDLSQSRGDAPYHLEIRPTRPDFTVTATTDLANVVQGGRSELELRIERQGGLAGPIDLKVEGLPAGVRMEPMQIPAGVEITRIAFVAADDTRPGDALLKITATAKVGEEVLTRELATSHLGRDVEGVSLGAPTTDHVQLTVRHKQVFRLFCSEAYQYAHRGTIYPYLMEVERMNGFDGEIRLEMGDRQIMDLDGVQIVNSIFPAGKSQLMLPLYLPETMHINVQPHSNIYAQGYVIFQDKWGQRQSMLQVSEMRCMIRPLPTVAKLRVREKSLALRAGEDRTCVLEVDRTTNFQDALRVELLDPPAGLHMPAVVIAANAATAVASITVDPDWKMQAATQLKFRGTGELSPGVTVVSEFILPVVAK
jgi:hypothetical protein